MMIRPASSLGLPAMVRPIARRILCIVVTAST
jgi:hypothetical protein